MSENEMLEPTPEQIAAYKIKREELIKHWNDEIPKLQVELEYNQLLEKIEVSRFNTWATRVRTAEMMAPPPEKDPEPLSKKEPTVPS